MNTRPQLRLRSILTVVAIGTAVMFSSPVHADGPYLAMAGQNQKVELLRLTDFSPVASIDVTPMGGPWLTFLPRTRRLYALDSYNTSGLNAVLDFSTCSSALLRPVDVSTPVYLIANGDESTLLLSSNPGEMGLYDAVNSVVVIDPASDTVTGVLSPTTTGSVGFGHLAFDAESNEFYVASTGGMRVYDATTLVQVRQCRGVGADIIARGKAYGFGSAVYVTDPVTCNPVTTISLPGNPAAAVRTRAGDKIYVLTDMPPPTHGDPNYLSDNAVTVIDTLTDQGSTILLNRELNFNSSMVLSADETSLYVAMDGSLDTPVDNALGVLNVQTGALQQYPIDTIPVGWSGLALIDKLGFQCGDGVIDTACGEQCDPPGSVVNGNICDANCTMGCGNGIVSGTEQCDDGNTNNNDACKNDCTLSVCGDGVVYRGVEQCDDGALNGTPGDACSATCTLPPRTASGQVAAGGALTTDVEGDGATASAPVETWITSPLAGSVAIEEGAPDPTMPSGYAFLGYSVHVTVPSSTADNPIVLVFELYSSLLPAGSNQTAVEFSKDGVLVADCTAGGSVASPDPCVASRAILPNGNLHVTIRSSTASHWGGLAPWHDAQALPRLGVSLTIPANKLLVTRKIPVRVRNADPLVPGKKPSTPIQLTATNVDCPLGLIADVPDFNARKPFSQDSVVLTPRHTATARLRLVASRFAFPKASSPVHCTIKLSAAALVVNNVDPTPANNTTTVQITVTTR
jgi:cysteine-rich repeat protein